MVFDCTEVLQNLAFVTVVLCRHPFQLVVICNVVGVMLYRGTV